MGTGVGLLIIILYQYVGNMFPDMSMVQYSERILGKWLGKIVSILFCFHIYMLSGCSPPTLLQCPTLQNHPAWL